MSAPYRPGDRAKVLHAGRDGGTRLAELEVRAVAARTVAGGWWRVVFGVPLEAGGWDAVTVLVRDDGRDLHGYVEPVRP